MCQGFENWKIVKKKGETWKDLHSVSEEKKAISEKQNVINQIEIWNYYYY